MTTLQLNFVKTAAFSKDELTLMALAPVAGVAIGGLSSGGYSAYKTLSGEKEDTTTQLKRALKGMGLGALGTSGLAGIYFLSKYLGEKLKDTNFGHYSIVSKNPDSPL